MKNNTISGRITIEAADGSPVAGLYVVMCTQVSDGDTIDLGHAITNRDGEFFIVAKDMPEALQDRLTLIVRNARSVEIEVVTLKTARKGVPVRITIPRTAAEVHGRHITLPASPDTPFIPLPHMVDMIIGAVDLIALKGTELHDRYLNAAKCPIPRVQLATEIYREGLDVLRGNPYAASRFVELIEIVNADAAGAEMHMQPETDAVNEHIHRRWVPSDAPFVPSEKTIPIFAAISLIARSGLYSLDRLSNGVLMMLCQFEDFGFIHRLAVESIGSMDAQARFAAVLDWRFPECGPFPQPQGPGIPWPERRKCHPWIDWHRDCLNQTTGGGATAAYTITQVTPAVACPGDIISISGTQFGTIGKVVFRRLGGGELEVTARTWTDTLITVEVPNTTANGLWLRIPTGTRIVCGVLIETSAAGQVYEGFDGSAPNIYSFNIGNRLGPDFWVAPGSPINLHWSVYGATNILVEVFNNTGAIVVSYPNMPGNAYLASLFAPMVNAPQLWRARIVATGPCSPGLVEQTINFWISEDPVLVITGIEVTQAIQYFQSYEHLTDTADRKPDNSVTLVQNKDAWVRVYIKSFASPAFNGANWTGLKGTLRVERIENGQVAWSTTLNSQNTAVTVITGATYQDVRGNIGRTLNFVIPAAEARGRLRLTAACPIISVPFGGPIAQKSVTVDFALQQRLRVAGIMVAYDGPPMLNAPLGTPNLVLAAPTVADLDNTLPYTLATYPIGRDFQTRNAGNITLTVPLDDPRTAPGACSVNWGTLLNQLTNARTADGNQAGWAYYGLLPNGVPINVPGCGGAVAGGFNGEQVTLAHELGHVFGRQHAPCGNAGTTDAAYPSYEPYDSATNKQAVLGEYGLDIRNGTIHPPTEHDFMSYCAPQWVSLHNYAALTNAANLNPVTVPVGAAVPAPTFVHQAELVRRYDMINIVGRVDEDGNYHVDSVARASVQNGPTKAKQTRAQIELLDVEGKKIAFGWIFAYIPHANGNGPCNCGQSSSGESLSPPFVFEARLLYSEGGVLLRIREGEAILWERRAFDISPTIKVNICRFTKNGDLEVCWSSNFDPSSSPDFWIQWAPIESEDWRGLAVGLRGNEATLNADALPSGRIQIRVSLHDGFTTTFDTKVLNVPKRVPTISILHPTEGETLDGSQGLLLWGRAVESDGSLVMDEQLVWRLNKRKIGSGGELRLTASELGDGEMEVEFIAAGISGRSSRKVRFCISKSKPDGIDG